MLPRDNYPDPRRYFYMSTLEDRGYVVLPGRHQFPHEEYTRLVFDSHLRRRSWPETMRFGVDFASIASPDGSLDVRPFGNIDHRRAEKGGRFTVNAERCPSVVRWVTSIGANFGTVRILKKSNSINDLRDLEAARSLYHRDTTNLYNEPGSGWIVRMLVQLTDNPQSYFLSRKHRDSTEGEERVPLSAGTAIVFDADLLWHTVWHPIEEDRFALLISLESSAAVEAWIARQMAGDHASRPAP